MNSASTAGRSILMHEHFWPVPVLKIQLVTGNTPYSRGIRMARSSAYTAARNIQICEPCLHVLVPRIRMGGITRPLMETSLAISPASFVGAHSMTLGRWLPVRAQGTLNVAATIRRREHRN